MRKNLTVLIAPLILGACVQDNRPSIAGNINGVESDTLLVTYYPAGNMDARKQDTIPMQQGRFSFEVNNDSVATEVYLMAKPSMKSIKKGVIAAMTIRAIPLMILPGESVNVTGSFEDYQISGGKFYEEVNEANGQNREYTEKIRSLSKQAIALSKAKAPEDSIRKAYELIQEYTLKMADNKVEYIRQHPNSDASVYLTSMMPLEQLEKALALIGEQVKNGVLAPYYRNQMKVVERSRAMQEAQNRIQPGKAAPDFTLKDLAGKDFTLSSLKGKYVILDFWGSWCGWCIKGFPELKKAYGKHKNKMEVVGIDCRDTEKKWKDAVEEHMLPWLNVRNEDNPDVTVMYAVSGYPTKILINPEGNISKIAVGEDPAFYTYLDDLLK